MFLGFLGAGVCGAEVEYRKKAVETIPYFLAVEFWLEKKFFFTVAIHGSYLYNSIWIGVRNAVSKSPQEINSLLQ